MAMKAEEEIKIGKRSIAITHPQTVLFPQDNLTKKDLINYYHFIAPHMVEIIKNRPLMLNRFPSGITEEGFYQKNVSDYFPSWMKTARIKKEGGYVRYAVCNNEATLLYLANQATITFHSWLSKIDKPQYPDRIIFDFDAAASNFSAIAKAALHSKALIEDLGLIPFVMTTGSRGLHVVIPIKRQYRFDVVREFARAIAASMVDQNPSQLTIELRKEKRGKKILIDYFRNSYGATAVAAYSVRAKPKAPIATPLHWDEVKDPRLSSQRYTLSNISKRMRHVDDPWKDLAKSARSITAAKKNLGQ